MLGIVLAGGTGSRLHPLTKVANKCLLPVYDRPMVYWPIQTLVNSGIRDILLVCGGNSSGEFLRILGNGEDFGLGRLNYAYQSHPRGVADALGLAKEWSGDQSIAVILADNIFEHNFTKDVEQFHASAYDARIFLTTSTNPHWYGVVELGADGQIKSIEEKPQKPKANTIATGIYMYKPSIWNEIEKLSPSARGELEITDLNTLFLQAGKLAATKIEGYWGDAGESIDVYLRTCWEWSKRQKRIKK